MAQHTRICLCMIVCNESHIIARALRSVRAIIDYWVICDTGSVDSTPVEILTSLSGIPGELHRIAWVNFGHNRTEAIRLAKGKADYILILDADMIVRTHGPFKGKLTADAYYLRYEGDIDYSQIMLVSDKHDWVYTGVTHEYIDAPTCQVRDLLPELTLIHFGDGAMRSDKAERDVRLLTAAVEEDPENIRNMFYLAESYMALGNYAEAQKWYEKRATLEGWDEERWYAKYQTARARHRLGHDWDVVLDAYTDAYNMRPMRLEPVYEIVKHYREIADYHSGYKYASAVSGLPYPNDLLFINRPVYEYLLALELGVCAYGTGRISEAVAAFNTVLRCANLPQWVKESAIRGRDMAVKDLYPAARAADVSNRIVVITPFYNPGAFLQKCVQSLIEQDYSNYEVLFLDDASTDSSARYLSSDERKRILRNPVRRGLAANLHFLLMRHCRPDDIVVCLDGDDWLSCPNALTYINECYNEHDCWVMYGQFQYADGRYGFSEPFASPRELSQQRRYFRTSHIRTFRAGLFHAIALQDPEFSCLKDDAGNWLQYSADAALMFPLVEMAGFERVRFNEKILYVYNDQNPLCDHHTNRQGQLEAFEIVSRKPAFAKVADF